MVQLAADGREQGHAAARRGIGVFGFRVPPRVLVLVEDAAPEAAFDGLVAAVAVFRPRPVFPLFEADIDLADVEDKLEDSVAEFGRQTEEGGELSVTLPSGRARCQRLEDSTAITGAARIDLQLELVGVFPGKRLV